MKPILLHTCCAPCSAAIIEWLLDNGWRPTLFYYNPNIFPEEEYLIRKNECTRYARQLGLDIIDGDYTHEAWLAEIAGFEHERERGERCFICFRMRLMRTAQLASELGITTFATTLASSRWKDLDQIARAGKWAADRVMEQLPTPPPTVEFWDRNWRKDGLTERRRELLAQNAFYNQTYCGCEFSVRK